MWYHVELLVWLILQCSPLFNCVWFISNAKLSPWLQGPSRWGWVKFFEPWPSSNGAWAGWTPTSTQGEKATWTWREERGEGAETRQAWWWKGEEAGQAREEARLGGQIKAAPQRQAEEEARFRFWLITALRLLLYDYCILRYFKPMEPLLFDVCLRFKLCLP